MKRNGIAEALIYLLTLLCIIFAIMRLFEVWAKIGLMIIATIAGALWIALSLYGLMEVKQIYGSELLKKKWDLVILAMGLIFIGLTTIISGIINIFPSYPGNVLGSVVVPFSSVLLSWIILDSGILVKNSSKAA